MDKPIVFFDLETTDKEVDKARICQIACRKMSPDLLELLDERVALINPGVPIPEEVTKIHGITDLMVADKPMFVNLFKAILDFMAGCDLAGFNILGFDIPVLSEELARVGISNWPAAGTRFFDAMNIFHLKEKRDLAGASLFYLGEEHTDAHDARADIIKTVDVFKKQLFIYDDLANLTGEELHRYCQGEHEWVDLAGKIVMVDGQAVYNFGKDKGKSVKASPGFGQWMLKNSFPTNTKNVVRALLS